MPFLLSLQRLQAMRDAAIAIALEDSIDSLTFDSIVETEYGIFELGQHLHTLYTQREIDDKDIEVQSRTRHELFTYGITYDRLALNTRRAREVSPSKEDHYPLQPYAPFLGEACLTEDSRPTEPARVVASPARHKRPNRNISEKSAIDQYVHWATTSGIGKNGIAYGYEVLQEFKDSRHSIPEVVPVGTIFVDGQYFDQTMKYLLDNGLLSSNLTPRGALKTAVSARMSAR